MRLEDLYPTQEVQDRRNDQTSTLQPTIQNVLQQILPTGPYSPVGFNPLLKKARSYGLLDMLQPPPDNLQNMLGYSNIPEASLLGQILGASRQGVLDVINRRKDPEKTEMGEALRKYGERRNQEEIRKSIDKHE